MGKKNHRYGRPPKNATEVLALNERGRWIPDDGKRHRAFSFREDNMWPIAMWSECDCSLISDACPGVKAMHKTSDRFGCANGFSFTRTWSKP